MNNISFQASELISQNPYIFSSILFESKYFYEFNFYESKPIDNILNCSLQKKIALKYQEFLVYDFQ